MYTKLEITMLYLSCKNVTEVFLVTEALKYLMEETKDFKAAAFIRRAANTKIKNLVAGSKL